MTFETFDPTLSRRRLLGLGTAGAAATGLALVSASPASAGAAAPAAVNGLPVPRSWRAVPFGLDQVRLAPSVFTEKRDRILTYARAFPVDDILYNFRANAGLDTKGAQPPGGWDDATGNLRGHFSGHLMSMLAQAWAGTGEQIFHDHLDEVVAGLKECQDALDAQVGRPGTPPPSPSWGAGRFGGGLTLTGDDQYVGLPDATVDGLHDFTIALWVNVQRDRQWARAFDFGTGTTAYMFLTPNAGSGPRFAITTTGSGGEQRIDGSSPLPTGEWVHLAVVRAGQVGTLYVNGAAAGTNTALTLGPADLGAPKNNWLGRSQFSDATLNGGLDEFHLFDHALSPTDIAALASSAAGNGHGNLAYYPFDATSGFTVSDASGRSWDAAVVTGTGQPGGPSHVGFLAAYPETQFIELENLVTYPAIWAPWYTCHKIMRGLLDAYTLTGNATALEVVTAMGGWVYSRLGGLPRQQLDQMWSLYIAGEYGGMNEVMADLYSLTGEPTFFAAAKCFDTTQLIADCAAGNDTLDGLHANQHIPQFLGYLRIFEQGGSPTYRQAARRFFSMVTPHRTYVHGGTGQGEVFRKRDAVAATIVGETNAESCAAYNMLKVARNLFFHAPDRQFMDYYEKALVNQILASRQDADSTDDPLVTYMLPVGPGAVRGFGNLGTCCGGTGLENHTKYQDTIYARSTTNSTLWVNLFIPSTVTWPERGLRITQSGDYPRSQSSTITVAGRGRLDLRVRVPQWATAGFTLTLNGVRQTVTTATDGYATIDRIWKDGDVLVVDFPYTVHLEKALDDPTLQALLYGPLAMVAASSASDWLPLTISANLPLSGRLDSVVIPSTSPSQPPTLNVSSLRLQPFFVGSPAPYHAYLRRTEPTIVFAGQNSGVPNRSTPTGTTYLDAVWSHAPFSSAADFRATVSRVAARWVSQGLMSQTEASAVTATAKTAPMRA